MNNTSNIILACIIGALVLIDGGLITKVLLDLDKNEVLHDQLIIEQSKREQLEANYNKLLERVGGAEPFTPYIAPGRPGSIGDK